MTKVPTSHSVGEDVTPSIQFTECHRIPKKTKTNGRRGSVPAHIQFQLHLMAVMKVIVWCLLLALIAVPTVRALLTTGEKTSLQSILDTFPSLSAVPREYSYLGDSFVGGSWPTNGFDHVCEAPGEYFQIYGVLCKNGHVVGLGLYVQMICIYEKGLPHSNADLIVETWDGATMSLRLLMRPDSI